MTPRPAFQPTTFAEFLRGYSFVREEDYQITEAMLNAINTPAAFDSMVDSIEKDLPGIAGVVDLLDPHLAEIRVRSRHDVEALERLHRLTQSAGALVKAVVAANGGEKVRVDKATPMEMREFAKTAATYRLPSEISED